jgi:hypothetical protein
VDKGGKMKKFFFLMSVILLISACSPNQAPSEISPQPEKKLYTSTPAPVITDLLNNAGFHQTRNYCTVDCTSYELYDPHVIAKVFTNGSFSIQTVANTSGVLDMQVINNILTQEYGQELTNWVTENFTSALRKEQTAAIGDYNITMSGKANEKMVITITSVAK